MTKTYLARRLFCVYCAGEHDDSAAKVGPRTWNGHGDGFLRPCMGFFRVSTGFFMGCIQVERGRPRKAACTAAGVVLFMHVCAQVTKEFLTSSFHAPWWQPGDGSVFVHRMVESQTPRNTVPCALHAQIRCPPRVLGIIWCAFNGVWPCPRGEAQLAPVCMGGTRNQREYARGEFIMAL